MERTLIKDLGKHIEEEVLISGWIDVRRDHGKLIFLDIRDGGGKVQCIALPDRPEVRGVADEVRPEWVVTLTGTVNRRSEKTKKEGALNGDIEVEIEKIEIVSKAEELPFEKDAELNLDTYLDHLPLTLRSEKARKVFNVQSRIISSYREALSRRGFIEFQSPKLVGDDAEGGGNVFEVEYFNEKSAYLATSPQLYKQIMVGVYERVFSTGNVFRAEKHSTTRHLNEYTSLDAEFGFIRDHHDVMDLLGEVVREIAEEVKDVTEIKIPQIVPEMKLREAQELISKSLGKDCTNEPDLEPAHERWLSEYARQELNSDLIFITHYPVSKRPFYTHEDEDDKGFTKSFDLLFRGVELATGGQRVHQYSILLDKLKEKGLAPENFLFYLQAFKYGMPPHGGWGMGLERFTQKVLNLENVKEATLFPREMNRIDTLLSQ